MLYVAIGIIGATVMPHNLYLHSASCRAASCSRTRHPSAAPSGSILSTRRWALTIAFFVNAAILVLAAMVFFGKESVTVRGRSGAVYRRR